MIDRVQIKNFKCFENQEINCNNLTILSGANASGKSSIIQSILLYYGSEDYLDKGMPIDCKSILGVEIGSVKNFVFQRAESSPQEAFSISIDGNEHIYSYNQDNQMDLKVHGGEKSCVKNVWYLNAERLGPRITNSAGGLMKMQSNGSNAIYMMDTADNLKLSVPEGLKIDSVNRKFSRIVEMWMSTILEDIQLFPSTDIDRAKAEMRIKNSITDYPVVPTMTGFGISYVLPIVVAGLFMAGNGGGVLLVENPEAHLHPSAQSNIGKFLAYLSQYDVQVIVETHSEHVIDGARIELLKIKKTNTLSVLFMAMEKEKANVSLLCLDESGEIEEWPKGFFDQKRLDLMELFAIRRSNEE